MWFLNEKKNIYDKRNFVGLKKRVKLMIRRNRGYENVKL